MYLFALVAACRISFLLTAIEGKPTPGSGSGSRGSLVWVSLVGVMESFSSPLSVSIGCGVFLQPISISIWLSASLGFEMRIPAVFDWRALSLCTAEVVGVTSVVRQLLSFAGSVGFRPFDGDVVGRRAIVGSWSVAGGWGQHILLLWVFGV